MGTEMKSEIVTKDNVDAISTIMSLRPLFPKTIRDDIQKVEQHLTCEHNINMFLKKEEKVVGYLLGTPHNDAIAELKKTHDDEFMKPDSNRWYLDQVAVLPKEREHLNFLTLVYDFLDEMGKRGSNRISSHILATNGLHHLILRIFGRMLTEKDMVNLNMHKGLPFLYIEGTYEK